MTAQYCRQQFSDHLFWDVYRDEVDMDTHDVFVVQRVLEYGTMSDWYLLRDYYGLAHIVAVCRSLRSLDPVCLSFISAISGTPKELFRCYHTRQSMSTPWNS